MRLAAKTALGIDVSDGRINLALLKQTKKGPRLLRTASAPVPDGALQDGNVQDPALLAKAIKKLAAKNRMHSHRAAAALLVNPMLMQILELPQKAGTNVRQFIQAEVKNCAILPGQEVGFDYFGLQPAFKPSLRRALVVAADGRRIDGWARELNRAGLNVEAIEPAALASIRAFSAKVLANRIDHNVLFAFVGDGDITLLLFRNQALDLVRIKRPEPDVCRECTMQSQKCRTCLADEISVIVEFYELEAEAQNQQWQIKLFSPTGHEDLPEQMQQLRPNLSRMEMTVCPWEQAYLDTPFADAPAGQTPSARAVGLAMKLLETAAVTPQVNLLPAKLGAAKSSRKELLAIGTAAAAVLLAIIASVSLLGAKGNQAGKKMGQSDRVLLTQNTAVLLGQRAWLDRQIHEGNKAITRVGATLRASPQLDWAQVLDEVRLAMPQMVRVTDLASRGPALLRLQGHALGHGDVRLFVDTLAGKDHITSAVLVETKTAGQNDHLVKYTIDCSLI